MLECADPGLVELVYMDTDSAVFSATQSTFEECLRPEKVARWKESDIIADEEGPQSCHGKMKLEGTYSGGKFRALKIYRLYEINEETKKGEAVYTRSKGVNRNIATRLPDDMFEPDYYDRVVVHRQALRPTRAGEMQISAESRTMVAPFNLKRFVDPKTKGFHTFPISMGAEKNQPSVDVDNVTND
jgi:hypothetical protein